MILYGASGHGKVIIEILEESGEEHIVIWDDNRTEQLWHYPVTAPLLDDTVQDKVIIAVGVNSIRKKIADKINQQVSFGHAIHPGAYISKRAQIGAGTVVMAGCAINADAIIGKHCIVNTNASVDHDCILGDFVHISPNVALCGNVTVGEGTHIGTGVNVIPGVKIGKWCTIGAGTVVIKDIPDFAVVVGNPGKVIKFNQGI